MLDGLDSKELESLLLAMLEAKENEKMIFFLGNGGSASLEFHYVNDLCKFASRKGKKFKALSLSDNISWFSSLANDEGCETIFVSKLENFVKKGDLVIGISASDNSKNIINVFNLAKKGGGIYRNSRV